MIATPARARVRIILICARRCLAAVAIGLVPAVVAAGCGGSDDHDSLRIVAGFYPLAEVATRVGGTAVSVDNLTAAGAEPHDLELRPSQVADIEDADLVVLLGRGFQPAVERAARDRQTIFLLDDLSIRGDDPHIWLDPRLMVRIVRRVAEALEAADSSRRSTFAANARRYEQELEALDDEYERGLARCRHREIVTAHAAFGRLAARYGLTLESIAGLSPDAEPSPDRLAQLTDLVRKRGVTTIFTETLVSPRVARTLAREAGVRTEVLDPIEGLSRAQLAAGANYVSVMRANLRKLRTALECSER